MSAILEQEIVVALNKVLTQDECHFVILLGSALTERFGPDSDIDLALYFVGEPTWPLKKRKDKKKTMILS